ncbi:YrdB family protein [Mycetocola spongiae]|nr:YrdB family protein [Mycetocola spongiae]
MWGIFSWPFPWNIGVGIAAPALVILIWALFNSPRAVFHLDLFGRSLVEIIVMFAAALALFSLGGPMQIVAAVFAVVAAVSGLIHGRRQLAD